MVAYRDEVTLLPLPSFYSWEERKVSLLSPRPAVCADWNGGHAGQSSSRSGASREVH